ncbi:Phosphoribosyl-ATP pyrophosphatase [Frankliniella fusca]|uniref:Phosphoribosyl-ATP pyrophosphatase n=1 Tax=Frankliniella fusca TaxID=407009 RepID=A0AAE1L6V6_9NEOP|nr:Phosphoribosyl-ATP pyrophosphatase [Frankliniella fusca]
MKSSVYETEFCSSDILLTKARLLSGHLLLSCCYLFVPLLYKIGLFGVLFVLCNLSTKSVLIECCGSNSLSTFNLSYSILVLYYHLCSKATSIAHV